MNAIEKEVLILNSVLEATSDLMSTSLVSPFARDGIVTEVKPKDNLGKRLFAIILLELVSDLDTKFFKAKRSALEYLIEIGQAPKLGGKQLGKRMAKAAQGFQNWLDKEFDYEFDSAMGQRIKVRFTRKEVISFCGNFQKHFCYRLGSVAKKMSTIYARAGSPISGLESLNLLEDVQTWLYDDVFAYHFTKICEHVSTVNNAIEAYLMNVYKKRFKRIDETFYKYTMPRDIKSDFVKWQYYELLNKIRRGHRRPAMIVKAWGGFENRY